MNKQILKTKQMS